MGWIHWSRRSQDLSPASLTFEMWPDMSEYAPAERFAAPGFTYPDGTAATLFSSDHPDTVLRHFRWMRDYGIDGAWLQQFVVDLPGGAMEGRYASRLRVLGYVREAAEKTGRTWAVEYDMSGAPPDRLYDVITSNWKSLVDDKTTINPRYLHEKGNPVVQLWGFYPDRLSPAQAARLVHFFKSAGPYHAYVVGGGDWRWRSNSDRDWQDVFHQLDAISPWNTGNYTADAQGIRHAATATWEQDQRECARLGIAWIPVIYPGFSWDNLQQKAPGTTAIARRRGQFLWEQFRALAKLKPTTTFIAMFDEVDEGTAIFKVTSSPPTQGHFVGYEGLPSDWYLRVVNEGGKLLRGEIADSPAPPIERPQAQEERAK